MNNNVYKIYGQGLCPFCERAKELLKRKNIAYEYVDLSLNPDAMDMFRDLGLRTVPQIWCDKGKLIGGYQELAEALL